MTIGNVLAGRRRWSVENMDCFDYFDAIPDGRVDAVVTDPIYAEVNRKYGRMKEADWRVFMQRMVWASLDVLTPTGSAVFVLQANQLRMGRMRSWLFWFMWWCAEELPRLTGDRIGLVQDVYWWNPTMLPNASCQRKYGLLRPSVKACVWIGPTDCYRAQDEVLWSESASQAEARAMHKIGSGKRRTMPSGFNMDIDKCYAAAAERGGVTPFNLLPVSNANSTTSSGAGGHGAGTPLPLMEWWVRYLCPLGGVVLDPQGGRYTTGVAALTTGRRFLGCEQTEEHHRGGVERLQAASRV